MRVVIFLIFAILFNCLKAKRSPFDVTNPISGGSLLYGLSTTTSSNNGTNAAVSTSSKDLLSYSIPSLGINGIIRGNQVSLSSDTLTSFTPLVASFTTNGKSVMISGVSQISGTTSNSYSSNLVYTITAHDGSTKDYTISLTAPRTYGGGSLKSWLKVDSLSLADGAQVASWNDSSGTGNNFLQGTGGLQPIFKTNQINGLPALRFTGGKILTLTGGTGLYINESGSFFAVLKFNTSVSAQSLFNVGGTNNRQFDFIDPTLVFFPGRNGVGNWTVSNSPIPISTFIALGTVQVLQTSSTEYWNGDLKGTQTTGIFNYAGGTTGYISNGLLDADIAEILYFNTALSQNETDKIFCYLRLKYNLTSTTTSCGI